jgi:putative transposase
MRHTDFSRQFLPRLQVIFGVVAKLKPESLPRLQVIFGDRKYHNYEYYDWLRKHSQGKWNMEISSAPAGSKEFKPLPIRWVVERTFAWIGRRRRNSKDYERRTDSSESMVLISNISLMVRRLRPGPVKTPPFHYPRPVKA